MERRNNYLIQAAQAKQRFLTYDQAALIQKFGLEADKDYFYVNLLCKSYRLNRHTGDLEKCSDDGWADGNSYEEVMTLLDLLCDSRNDRRIAGRWENMQTFGNMFHRELLEVRNPVADRIDREPDIFRQACRNLDGLPLPGCDIGFGMELFDGLRIGIQFWHGDEEFYPRLRYLWDANARQYLCYETMYFAVDLLRQRILEEMDAIK